MSDEENVTLKNSNEEVLFSIFNLPLPSLSKHLLSAPFENTKDPYLTLKALKKTKEYPSH